jgi:hypothetical protein
MKDLIRELKEVNRLKRESLTEIVIREEKWHYEYVDMPVRYYFGPLPFPPQEPIRVVDIPGITLPDSKAQNVARERIGDIYRETSNLLVRYSAGRAVGEPLSHILYYHFRGSVLQI